ncbi:MAG: DNA internalization-related competence protein ComEC/Rec2 [Gammaproteobacteria bacterium]|nr:DNA internalization-related competence protein ComEC/Rec2 [Gammaproteobacteria bacterium]
MNAMRQYLDGWNKPYAWLLLFCGGVIAPRFFAALPPLPAGAAKWHAALALASALLPLAFRFALLRPAAALALGLGWAVLSGAAALEAGLPAALEKKDVVISGRVVGVPATSGRAQRFDFEIERLVRRGDEHALPRPFRARLRLFAEQPQIRSGQRWRFTARLKRARGYQNPGAHFNQETYLFHHRLRASGYVRTRPRPQLLSPPGAFTPSGFRQRVAAFIRDSLGDGGRAGLVTALSVGLRSDMRAGDWDVLTRTGTIHLVAISGLHIGLVSALVLMLAGRIWRFAGKLPLWLPAPKFGVLAGLAAGLVYALLAGMTIPTQRAACMLAVVALAMFFTRRPFGGETLLLALTLVLAVDPLAPLSGGFWLSFGAVAVLMMSAEHMRVQPLPIDTPIAAPFRATRNAARHIRMWSAAQAVLFIGMAPLLLALFQRVSLSAPLANLAAIPLIGMVAVPLALFGLLLYALGLESAAAFAFGASHWVIEKLWLLLEALAAMRWSVWRQPAPPWWALPPAALGACLLLSRRALPARASGLLWMLPLFFTAQTAPGAGEFRYTMLEVGNGLASVVQTQNHFLVYDAGPRYESGYDSGEAVVAPYLRMRGAKNMDALVVSHGDNDHSGGRGALLAQFSAGEVFTSDPELMPDARRCAAGQKWEWDGVEFAMLWPPPDTALRGNEASCVLKITSRFGSLLLSGDIGALAEEFLLESGAGMQADILLAPHHGSKTSSTGDFLRRVNPRAALASAGYLNRYDHPHREVRARYAAAGIPLLITADEGAITASFSSAGITLRGRRASERKYWMQPARQLRAPMRIHVARDSEKF